MDDLIIIFIDRYADTSGAANDVYEFVSKGIFSKFLKQFVVTFSYICNVLYDFRCRLSLLGNLKKPNGPKEYLHLT